MIELCNVNKFYPPEQYALKGIDLKISAGEFVFVAGASGAGKSTLLKLLLGADRVSDGTISVAGRDLIKASSREIAFFRREIGVVFQDYKLLPRRTVLENISVGLAIRGIRSNGQRDLAMQMLEFMGIRNKADCMPITLSGGEQQRVAIARALVHKPRLILADEPTGNLDVSMTKVVFDLLLEANKEGVTVVIASHNLAIMEELNKRTIVLDRGKMIGDFEKAGSVA